MRCQRCSKNATVHLTEIVNGEKTEKHLCEDCAQKEGVTIKAQVPISELLDNLAVAQAEAQQLNSLSCPQCGISWSEFRKSGSLGCPHDYIAFEEPLHEILERAHEGACSHVGKIPQRSASHATDHLKLLMLRKTLRKAVADEDYEAAARIRDQIRQQTMN